METTLWFNIIFFCIFYNAWIGCAAFIISFIIGLIRFPSNKPMPDNPIIYFAMFLLFAKWYTIMFICNPKKAIRELKDL